MKRRSLKIETRETNKRVMVLLERNRNGIETRIDSSFFLFPLLASSTPSSPFEQVKQRPRLIFISFWNAIYSLCLNAPSIFDSN